MPDLIPEALPIDDPPPGGTTNTADTPTLAAPVSAPGSVSGAVVAGFELIEVIGRGGMGVVYRAREFALARDAAVKVLHDGYPPVGTAADRFLAEARITAQLQHPAIPPVHHVGVLPDGRPFLAMKLIKGRTLEGLLKERSGPAAARGRFIAVFEDICQALGYAHSRNVIHRDLKPGNVMVGAFGEVQVMDWGLAKVLGASPVVASAEPVALTEVQIDRPPGSATETGSVLGTPAFMAPEQAGGEIAKIDRRSDVFGLGGILCAILTGQPPYLGTDAKAIRLMAIRGDLQECFARLDACTADGELVALCKRCLSVSPADRPADAGEVARAIAAFRAEAEHRARRAEADRAAAETRAVEQRKRRRVQVALLVAVVACGLTGAAALAVVEHERSSRRLEAVRTLSQVFGLAEISCEQARSVSASNGTEQEVFDLVVAWERADEAVRRAEEVMTKDPANVTPEMIERLKLLRDEAKERVSVARVELGRLQVRDRLLREVSRLEREEQIAQAAQVAREATQLDSTSAWSYLDLGDLLTGIGNYEDARDVYKKALALAQDLTVPLEGRRTLVQKQVRVRLDRSGRYLKLAPTLDRYLKQEAPAPAERDQQLVLAEMCFARGAYIHSATLYKNALTELGSAPAPPAEERTVRVLATRAYVFAGSGLGRRDGAESNPAVREEFRKAAWQLSQMRPVTFPTPTPVIAQMGFGGGPKDAEEAWKRITKFVQSREDRVHRLVLYPGPCLPDPGKLASLRVSAEERQLIQELIFAYSYWLTGRLLDLGVDGATLFFPTGEAASF